MNNFRVVQRYGTLIHRPFHETGLTINEHWIVNGTVFYRKPTEEEIENAYQSAEVTIEQKYQHALDIIQNLLNAYGCKTPQWEEARTLIDLERPLIAKESKDE
jgi:hypothetical protein